MNYFPPLLSGTGRIEFSATHIQIFIKYKSPKQNSMKALAETLLPMPATLHASPWPPLPAAIHTLVEATPNAILLETSRFDPSNRHSYLFLEPTRILTATTLDEIPALFSEIEAALAAGLHIAGYFSYECNGHFEPTSARAPE